MNLQESIRNDLNRLDLTEDVKSDFFKYVKSFYGDGEIYARYFTNDDGADGASIGEINKAIDTLMNDDNHNWGGGDSVDREKVRDIMLANRETQYIPYGKSLCCDAKVFDGNVSKKYVNGTCSKCGKHEGYSVADPNKDTGMGGFPISSMSRHNL